MVDYGGKMPELQERLCDLLKLSQKVFFFQCHQIIWRTFIAHCYLVSIRLLFIKFSLLLTLYCFSWLITMKIASEAYKTLTPSTVLWSLCNSSFSQVKFPYSTVAVGWPFTWITCMLFISFEIHLVITIMPYITSCLDFF